MEMQNANTVYPRQCLVVFIENRRFFARWCIHNHRVNIKNMLAPFFNVLHPVIPTLFYIFPRTHLITSYRSLRAGSALIKFTGLPFAWKFVIFQSHLLKRCPIESVFLVPRYFLNRLIVSHSDACRNATWPAGHWSFLVEKQNNDTMCHKIVNIIDSRIYLNKWRIKILSLF